MFYDLVGTILSLQIVYLLSGRSKDSEQAREREDWREKGGEGWSEERGGEGSTSPCYLVCRHALCGLCQEGGEMLNEMQRYSLIFFISTEYSSTSLYKDNNWLNIWYIIINIILYCDWQVWKKFK